MFTFVTGGLRAGKSGYALRRATELGPPPWLYLAPEVVGDDELEARLAKHRRDKEAIWRIQNAPIRLADALASDALEGYGAVVFDRFSVWLANRVSADPAVVGDAVDPADNAAKDRKLLTEIEELADHLYRSPVPAVLVTTEVGLGFLPVAVPDRRLINVVGMANQILAERAASVVFMVSGVAQRLR